LSTAKIPLIASGWMRSLLFFAAFLLSYLLLDAIYMQTLMAATVPLLYSGALVFAIAASIVVPLFVIYVDARSVHSLGFGRNGRAKDAITGTVLAITLLTITSIILVLANKLTLRAGNASIETLGSGLVIMFIVALAEETVFRGYILGNLLLSLNKWLALVVSSILFSVTHASNPGISAVATANVFLAGLLLGLNYLYTRNLWFSICFHLTWNFVQGPVMGFNVSGLQHESLVNAALSGHRWLTGDPFGLEGSVILTILLTVTIVMMNSFYKARRHI
jgi:uncharacterized protein